MSNDKREDKSSFFGKIDDIEAYVDENYGFMSKFEEMKEQLIEMVKKDQEELEARSKDLDQYGELMKQGKYMEAAALIITPEQMDKAMMMYGDVYMFVPKAKIVTYEEMIERIEDEAIANARLQQDREDDGKDDERAGFFDLDLSDIEYYKDVGAVEIQYTDGDLVDMADEDSDLEDEDVDEDEGSEDWDNDYDDWDDDNDPDSGGFIDSGSLNSDGEFDDYGENYYGDFY